MEELKRENAFYASHKTEFHEKYLDKWLVIAGDSLWGVFDKFAEAAQAAYQNLKPGEFMIHTPAEDDMLIQCPPIISIVHSNDEEDEDLDAGITATEGELIKFPYAN